MQQARWRASGVAAGRGAGAGATGARAHRGQGQEWARAQLCMRPGWQARSLLTRPAAAAPIRRARGCVQVEGRGAKGEGEGEVTTFDFVPPEVLGKTPQAALVEPNWRKLPQVGWRCAGVGGGVGGVRGGLQWVGGLGMVPASSGGVCAWKRQQASPPFCPPCQESTSQQPVHAEPAALARPIQMRLPACPPAAHLHGVIPGAAGAQLDVAALQPRRRALDGPVLPGQVGGRGGMALPFVFLLSVCNTPHIILGKLCIPAWFPACLLAAFWDRSRPLGAAGALLSPWPANRVGMRGEGQGVGVGARGVRSQALSVGEQATAACNSALTEPAAPPTRRPRPAPPQRPPPAPLLQRLPRGGDAAGRLPVLGQSRPTRSAAAGAENNCLWLPGLARLCAGGQAGGRAGRQAGTMSKCWPARDSEPAGAGERASAACAACVGLQARRPSCGTTARAARPAPSTSALWGRRVDW